MRLRLRFPDDWTYVEQPHQRVALAPGGTSTRPIAMVAWGPLFPGSINDADRLRQVLAVELATGRLDLDPEEAKQTDLGWRYTEQAARVVVGDRLAEERRAALFRFAEWRGVVVARSFDQAHWIALEPIVQSAFATATPDWRGDGEVICVAHLYEPVVD